MELNLLKAVVTAVDPRIRNILLQGTWVVPHPALTGYYVVHAPPEPPGCALRYLTQDGSWSSSEGRAQLFTSHAATVSARMQAKPWTS